MKQKRWKVYQPLLLAITLAAGMQLGYQLYPTLSIRSTPSLFSKSQPNALSEVVEYINARYVDSVDANLVVSEVIEETLTRLDPHSDYLPIEELEAANEQLRGDFEGIGIEFNILNDTLMVVAAVSGGPSEKVGLLPGDQIITINDSLVAGIGLKSEDVFSLLRGAKGTSVKVGIARKQQDELMLFDIKRDKIPLASLDAAYMISNETGYLKINRFSATTHDEFKRALDGLQQEGLQQLILDLRQNGGGILDAATAIADEFIEGRKVLVYTEGSKQKRREYLSKFPGMMESGKVVVLMDEGSASASEILAGALQDWDRATIMGRRSFGKGLVQEQYGLSDGSAIRLTVARYHTPSGRCIQIPYGDREKYLLDLETRWDNGEFFSPDSIAVDDSLKFYTESGRVVYGGGGIVPDVFVPADTSWNNFSFLVTRSFVPEFTVRYFKERQQYFTGISDLQNFTEDFSIDEELLSSFLDEVKTEEPELNLNFEPRETVALKDLMKAHLARQMWRNSAFYEIINKDDPAIVKAVEWLEG